MQSLFTPMRSTVSDFAKTWRLVLWRDAGEMLRARLGHGGRDRRRDELREKKIIRLPSANLIAAIVVDRKDPYKMPHLLTRALLIVPITSAAFTKASFHSIRPKPGCFPV